MLSTTEIHYGYDCSAGNTSNSGSMRLNLIALASTVNIFCLTFRRLKRYTGSDLCTETSSRATLPWVERNLSSAQCSYLTSGFAGNGMKCHSLQFRNSVLWQAIHGSEPASETGETARGFQRNRQVD